MHWHPIGELPSPDRYRVAFVGDSFTFGCWADDFRSGFVGVFDSILKSKGYDALNFGVGGYGLGDIELIVNEEVLKFCPSFVVLMFFNGNDFRDTYLGINKYKLVDGTLHWNQEIIEAKLPVQARPPERVNKTPRSEVGLKTWLKTHSAFARRAFKLKEEMAIRLQSRKNPVQDQPVSPRIPNLTIGESFTSYTYWSQVPYPPVAITARDVSLATLERIHASVKQIGARLIIVSIPYRAQVYVANPVGINYNISLPQKFVATFARDRDIPYLDLLPILRKHVTSDRPNPYVPGDPHFNDVGHRLVGYCLATWFLEEHK
ncbi:MAG: SGNH/GDSL hydrolase family protein [Syntrophaceae bacterium]|nr:SGNH/GDSL hydrolase family protein [Syntrophaceae bacterium]